MTIFERVVRWLQQAPVWAMTHYDPRSSTTVLSNQLHMSPVIDTAWYTDEPLILLFRGTVTGLWAPLTDDSPL